ncbi:MAG TPA: amidase [Caulobacteraceae bacterium]|jgi:Asp-tRNA(Asn)/Glu-tRNA(Gln) amidotransferase A subunit family amidase|nr:amidase [Caulobacteraceae bacterium]
MRPIAVAGPPQSIAVAAAGAIGSASKARFNSLRLQSVTIADVQAGFATGGLTAEALMRAMLARITVFEPAYNAFVFVNPNNLDEASRIDALRADGKSLGPMAGIPVAVKDSIDVAGMPTTCCWDRLAPMRGGYGLIPEWDAPVVARLRRAGAIIVGKTNTPAFSAAQRTTTSWAGTTYNALDRRLMPAGSSSGTATAVAAGFAVTGVAEETGGSHPEPGRSAVARGHQAYLRPDAERRRRTDGGQHA